MENEIKNKFALATLTEHPFIAAWRDAYRSFGVKPKKHRPTAEALIRRILKGEFLPPINTLVDSYLINVAESFLPCGGYDLSRIEGDIQLRYSLGEEKFTPIGHVQEPRKTHPGEIVYADAKKVLTRRWNYMDCDQTKITLDTRKVALFIEAVDKRIPTEALEKAVKRLQELILEFCGGEAGTFIATPAEKLEWKIV